MKIKRIILTAFAAVAALAVVSCDRELPYDLEGVVKGVAIDIKKVTGTSTTLATDMSGDYKIVLNIAKYQGDVSMLKEAQLMCIFTPADGSAKKTATVQTGITAFPANITVDLKSVVSKLGVSALAVGDKIDFCPTVVLKDDTVIPGWTEYQGFNNNNFTALDQDGVSKFSNRVNYTAFAPFNKDKYQGKAVMYEQGKPEEGWLVQVDRITTLPDASLIPAGVTEDQLYGMHISGGFFYGGDEIDVWINTTDYTLIIPDQVVIASFTYGAYGTYPGKVVDCFGEADTLHDNFSFYMYSVWGPYSLGDDTFVVDFSLL